MVHSQSFVRLPLLALPFGAFLGTPAGAQESRARFDAPLVVATPLERFETVADLNGDGFADAVSLWWQGASYFQARMSGWLNDQSGKLTMGWVSVFDVTPGHPPTWSVATGDLNGDGLPEIVTGIGSQVRVFRSTGLGVVSPAGIPPLTLPGPLVMGVRIDDYDGDGLLDVAVLHGVLSIYHADPTTLALTPFTELQSGTVTAQLHPVEMNGDGAPDLMVTDASNVTLYPIVGGQLQAPFIYPHQCFDPKPAAGDLDGDGDEDIVIWDMGLYTVLRRNGPTGYYGMEYQLAGGPARFLYDLDADGDLDGVCCGGGGGPTQVFNNQVSSYRMTFNDGQGNFSAPLTLPGLGSLKLAGAADLDHDGDLDLVSGRVVFYARGPWKSLAAPLPAQSNPRLSSLSDFDTDADLDIQLRTTGVCRNLGDGRPTVVVPRTPIPPPGHTFSDQAYCGDYDGDGDVDMVVAHRTTSPNAFVGMTLLTNDCGGTFSDAGDATAPGVPMTSPSTGPEENVSSSADVDADGDLDIVAGTAYDDNTRIWLNDGLGHFTMSAFINPGYVDAVADFNGDGIPDLVGHRPPWAGASYDYSVTWKGLGNGTFAASQYIGAPTIAIAAPYGTTAIGDVDQDGDVDIATGDYNGAIHVLLNNLSNGVTDLGPGQFTIDTLAQGSVTNLNTSSLFDVDGDGRLDLVCGPAGGNSYMAPNASIVFLRRSDNSGWEQPILQVLRATAHGDADGDGDVDAIGSNVWLNCAVAGQSASVCLQTPEGMADASGITPTLGGKGPFCVSNPVDLRLTGAPPQVNGVIVVVVGALQPELGPVSSVIGYGASRTMKFIGVHTAGTVGLPGTGSWRLPFTVPGYVANTTRSYVALLPDPAVPGRRVRSNELSIRYVP